MARVRLQQRGSSPKTSSRRAPTHGRSI
jgi:hypothetical protein